MHCDDVRALLEAYVLGALEADEQATIGQHMSQCPDCQREASLLTDAAHHLPHALTAGSPLRLPAHLKVRLLQSLGTLAPESVSSAPGASPAGVPPVATSAMPWWRRPRNWGIAAAIVLLVLSIASNLQLMVVLAQERALRAGLTTLVGQQEIVLEVVDSSKTIKRVLRPPGSGRAYGKVYTRADLPHVVAMAARLPPSPPGQAYHLWVSHQDQTQLAGVMTVNAQGFGLLIFDADRNGPLYDMAELTLQAEGSTTPASPPVLRWDASK